VIGALIVFLFVLMTTGHWLTVVGIAGGYVVVRLSLGAWRFRQLRQAVERAGGVR
jgi:hypothetical protein